MTSDAGAGPQGRYDWSIRTVDNDTVYAKSKADHFEFEVYYDEFGASLFCTEGREPIELYFPSYNFREFLKQLNNIVFPDGINSSS